MFREFQKGPALRKKLTLCLLILCTRLCVYLTGGLQSLLQVVLLEPGVTVKLQGQGFCERVLNDQWSSITVSWWKKQLIVAYCPFLSSRLHLRIEFTVNPMLYHNATRTLPSPPDNEVKYLPARLHFYSALYTLCSLFIHTGRALPVCCQRTFDIPKCSLILLFGLSLSASWCSCTHWFRPITCRVTVWITIVKLFGRDNTIYL